MKKTNTNCFAYKDGKCRALDVYKCGIANFISPKELQQEQAQKAKLRAKSKGYYMGTLDYKTKEI